MAVTGKELIDFVNAHGDDEQGVCQCSHWYEEHHDGTCEACLDNAADQDDPHAVADHAFVFSDEATAKSDYLNQRAIELAFPFQTKDLPDGQAPSALEASEPPEDPTPSDAWFIGQAIQDYQEGGSIDVDTGAPTVSRGEDGAYVKAWVFVEAPECGQGQS